MGGKRIFKNNKSETVSIVMYTAGKVTRNNTEEGR